MEIKIILRWHYSVYQKLKKGSTQKLEKLNILKVISYKTKGTKLTAFYRTVMTTGRLIKNNSRFTAAPKS